MCGIIGVASSKPSVDKLVIGLMRQEYRGYDSAGLAKPAESYPLYSCRINPITSLSTEGLLDATPMIPHIIYFSFRFKFTCFPLPTANSPFPTFFVITDPAPV